MSLHQVADNATTVRPEPSTVNDARLVTLSQGFLAARGELEELAAQPEGPSGSPESVQREARRDALNDAVGTFVEAAALIPAEDAAGVHAKVVLARYAAEEIRETNPSGASLPGFNLILSFLYDIAANAAEPPEAFGAAETEAAD